MPLEIIPKVVGKHSVEVDERACREILEDALEALECDASIELRIRRTHIKRGSKEPGVYAVQYNVEFPHSIEVIIFTYDEQTGRPATIVARSEEMVGLILEQLSTRLYRSWANSQRRMQGVETVIDAAPKKLLRRAGDRGDHREAIKALVSSTRSQIRAQGLAATALDIYACERSQGALNVDMFLTGQMTGCGCSELDVLMALLHMFEQFGLIEITEIPGGRLKPQIRTTDYCYELACQCIERKNEKRRKEWEERCSVAERNVTQGETKVRDAERVLEQRRAELERLRTKVKELQSSPPEPLGIDELCEC